MGSVFPCFSCCLAGFSLGPAHGGWDTNSLANMHGRSPDMFCSRSGAFAFHRRRWWFAGGLAALILLYAAGDAPAFEDDEPLYAARNFFGVKKVVYEVYGNQRKLLNGDTMHGLEGLDPARAGQPLSYYHISGHLVM